MSEELHPDVCPTCRQYKDSESRLFALLNTLEAAMHKAEQSSTERT